jgi:hypothetical protein
VATAAHQLSPLLSPRHARESTAAKPLTAAIGAARCCSAPRLTCRGVRRRACGAQKTATLPHDRIRHRHAADDCNGDDLR